MSDDSACSPFFAPNGLQTDLSPTSDQRRSLPDRDPCIGEMVRVRSRRWLVEDVTPPQETGHSSRVRLACAEDDAPGRRAGGVLGV